jgi:ABC-type phosphate transport system substrate-binding protein
MKKLLLIAIMLFATVEIITITGCATNPSVAPSAESRFIGKWTMQSAVSITTTNGSTTPQTTNFTANDYFEFKTGGVVTIVQSGVTRTGTWTIANDRVFFTGTNYMENTPGWAVLTLTASTLQFYNKEVTTSSTTEFTLNLAK